jgi:uncharacterized integral membrane protein
MPWRLIIFILIFAVFLAFITFNLENKCNVYFWFGGKGLIDIPVFLTIFVSFSMGLLCALPFVVRRRKAEKGHAVMEKKPEKIQAKKPDNNNNTSGSTDGDK